MTPWPRGDAVRNRTPPCSRRSVANLRRREACIVLGRASRRSRHSAASVPNRSRRAAPSTGRATARPADRDGSRLGELPMREACRPSTMTSAGAANLEVNAMNTTRLEILDRSVEKAHIWINEVAQELGTEDVHEAYRVLRAFLQALRDHLSVDEAAQLARAAANLRARRLLRRMGSQQHADAYPRSRQLPHEDRRGGTARGRDRSVVCGHRRLPGAPASHLRG